MSKANSEHCVHVNSLESPTPHERPHQDLQLLIDHSQHVVLKLVRQCVTDVTGNHLHDLRSSRCIPQNLFLPHTYPINRHHIPQPHFHHFGTSCGTRLTVQNLPCKRYHNSWKWSLEAHWISFAPNELLMFWQHQLFELPHADPQPIDRCIASVSWRPRGSLDA